MSRVKSPGKEYSVCELVWQLCHMSKPIYPIRESLKLLSDSKKDPLTWSVETSANIKETNGAAALAIKVAEIQFRCRLCWPRSLDKTERERISDFFH